MGQRPLYFFNSSSTGIVFILQNLTSKDDPRAESVKSTHIGRNRNQFPHISLITMETVELINLRGYFWVCWGFLSHSLIHWSSDDGFSFHFTQSGVIFLSSVYSWQRGTMINISWKPQLVFVTSSSPPYDAKEPLISMVPKKSYTHIRTMHGNMH